MEFLYQNFLNTTTQMAVSSNTSTSANLFTRDVYAQYYTDGFNNDATTASITITLDETTTVSRIALLDTNLRGYSIYYNGATANSFALTSTCSTLTSSFSGNTDSNIYLSCNATAVSSITIDMKTTQTANQEKVIGLLVLTDVYYSLQIVPQASNYIPTINPKQIVHTLSDGGSRLHTIRNKWSTSISLEYVSAAQRDSLKSVWSLQDAFNFCAFGTSTGWDGQMFEAIWDGPFDFYKYTDDAAVSGFSGSISLKETPT